jgi:hypothetical protein
VRTATKRRSKVFEVKVFCEDKKLDKLMWALDGLVVGLPQIIPVRGAKAFRGQVREVDPDGLSREDRIAQHIQQKGYTNITAQEISEIAQSYGTKPKSSYTMGARLAVKGVLKRTSKGKYRVLKSKLQPQQELHLVEESK